MNSFDRKNARLKKPKKADTTCKYYAFGIIWYKLKGLYRISYGNKFVKKLGKIWSCQLCKNFAQLDY